MTTPDDASIRKLLDRLHGAWREQVFPVLSRIPQYGRLIYLLATDNTLTAREKAPVYLALGYQVSPVDLIPGFIPVLGQLDDILAMLWGIRRVLDALPAERAQERLATAGLTMEQIESDTTVVRQALAGIAKKGATAVGRGLLSAATATITAGAYLGYLVYYTATARRGQTRKP